MKLVQKAIIYTRVSTDEQVTNFSLGFQEKKCREYANKEGWRVVKVFREEGASAKTIAGRPVLRELVKYCKTKKNGTMLELLTPSSTHHPFYLFFSFQIVYDKMWRHTLLTSN